MGKWGIGLGLLILMLLAGCEETSPAALDPVPFHADDECHVCGMIIADFPGPKGEAVSPRQVRRFCSVAEMLGWWSQPENQVGESRLYVHDMTREDWNRPDDAHLIDASQAWYVIGGDLPGAMGVTVASFAEEAAAEDWAGRHGGRVYRFEELEPSLWRPSAPMTGHH
ncbi:nitrous oxide reductase accessory protein NosL [Alloalcanivorax xenomutans]|uniref:nitrous oxide reductase accessory protein NosL n=1 Tax=Alloalcanivorax xenomutans TaxID=1094342 RepID=UPI0013D4A157|nr:nitrous oxide reductase accessory protein NosL [Alloalcanivorax xenomutans]WOA31296.1 nitrous oxide reductase accessory protein NosL [Alloalcanivorax xenomutans]